MGSWWSNQSYVLSGHEMLQIKRETGFNNKQIRKLLQRFKHLDKSNRGYLTRSDLLSIKEVCLNPVGEKVVEGFFPKPDEDHLTFPVFAKTFAVFRPVTGKTREDAINSREAKLEHLFRLLDNDNDGFLCRDDFHELLELMMGANVSDDQLEMIARRVIAEAGGEVSYDGAKPCVSLNTFKMANEGLNVGSDMAFLSLA